jgi:hypothetical protein
MTPIRQSTGERHGQAGPARVIPGWLLQGLVFRLIEAVQAANALMWSQRSRRPDLPCPRARTRPRRCLVRHRWQAIFPALPRPGPGPGAASLPLASMTAWPVTP